MTQLRGRGANEVGAPFSECITIWSAFDIA
jgi:hypothetical protein